MKMSQGVEWGLHTVTLLALTTSPVRRDRIAAHYGLPVAYLAKHLTALTKAAILTATPGPRGGYRLARPPEDITVLDVVEAIEGPAPTFTCQDIRKQGEAALPPDLCRRPCVINATMTQADQAWRTSLRKVTVADLVHRLTPAIRHRNESILANP